jgi:hypothetical protein
MTMMLLAIFAAAGLGTFVSGFGRREAIGCVAIAVVLTLLYFLRPAYMT